MPVRRLTYKEKTFYWAAKTKEILAEHPGAFITFLEVKDETDENGNPVYGKITFHKPRPTSRRE